LFELTDSLLTLNPAFEGSCEAPGQMATGIWSGLVAWSEHLDLPTRLVVLQL
jgi:hypothetical protein